MCLVFLRGLLEFAAVLHHGDTLRQPEVQDVYCLLLRTAAIAAQVQDQRGASLLLQVDKGPAHILGTALGKGVQVDIADVPLTDAIIGQLGQFDVPSGNLEIHQFARRGTHDLQQETRARLTAQMLTDVAYGLVGHHRVVDTQDHIALLQSGLGGRHVGIGLVNHHAVQFLVLADQRTNTRIFSCEHHSQVLRLVLCIVLRIRIQTAQHRVDTRANGLLRVQRIHIEQFQVLIHLIEDVKVLTHLEVMVLILLGRSRQRHDEHQQKWYNTSSHYFFFTFLLFYAAKLHDSRKKTPIYYLFLQKN